MNDIPGLIDDHLAAHGEPGKARRSDAVRCLSAEDAQPIDPLPSPAGQLVPHGCDFALVDDAGRLARRAGFFGPFPAHPIMA